MILRQRVSTVVIACLSVIALEGCVPATCVEVPALRGRVVGPDLHPVGGAVIRVVRDGDRIEIGTVSTRPDGSFVRPEQAYFCIQFAGADRALTTYSVTASAGMMHSPAVHVSDGIRRWFFGYYDPPLDCDLGTLQLR
jgi:hypothetical protein